MRGRPVLFRGFGGGVNTESAPYALKDDEARDARNVVSTARGAIRKRDGSQTFASPAAALTSLYGSLNPRFLLGSDGATIYSIDPAGVVATIGTGYTANTRWRFINAPAISGQGPIYGVNNAFQSIQWTGSGTVAAWTATTGTVPAGRFITYHGNRVWIAHTAVDGSALYFSNIGNPRDWPVANVVRFDPNDGENISGIGKVGPYLLVFKPSKAWIVYDLDTGANRPLAGGAGCVAHHSIVEAPSGTYFLSSDQGVLRTRGQGVERVSENITPTLAAIPPASRTLSTGIYFEGHYYLSFTTDGVANNLMADLDEAQGSWWLHTLGMAQMTIWEASAATPRLYGAPNAARIDRLFVPGALTDPGGAFNSYWSSPFHTFGKPSIRKRCRRIHFDGQGRIAISIAKDFQRGAVQVGDTNFAEDVGTFGGTGSFGGDGTFGGTVEVGEEDIFTPGVARAWSIVFGNSTAEDFQVESFTLAMQERTD